MPSIRDLLTARGLERIADQVESATRSSVYLTPGEQTEDSCSRLGGRPNLPSEIDWPIWNGRALPFIAQFDLAALSPVHGLDLPADGSLYFFFEGGEEAWGFKPQDRGSAQVIFTPTKLRDHALRALPDDIEDHLRFPGISLGIGAAGISVPSLEDAFVDELTLSFEERKACISKLGATVCRRRAIESGDTPNRFRVTRSSKRIWFRMASIVAMRADTTKERSKDFCPGLSIGNFCCRLTRMRAPE